MRMVTMMMMVINDDQVFAKRCAACSKPITGQGGTRFISFEGRHWHSDCFVCALCKQSMAGKVSGGYFGKVILIVFLMLQGFITDGDDIICPECAKDKLLANSQDPPEAAEVSNHREEDQFVKKEHIDHPCESPLNMSIQCHR